MYKHQVINNIAYKHSHITSDRKHMATTYICPITAAEYLELKIIQEKEEKDIKLSKYDVDTRDAILSKIDSAYEEAGGNTEDKFETKLALLNSKSGNVLDHHDKIYDELTELIKQLKSKQ